MAAMRARRPILPLKRRHVFTLSEVTTMVAVLKIVATNVDLNTVPIQLTDDALAVIARCKATEPGDFVRIEPEW